VLVSHDRALLRTVCDAFLLVADGKAQEFDGDLDDYLEWLATRRATQVAPDAAAPLKKDRQREARGTNPQAQKAPPGRRRPLAKEAEQLEQRLAQWQEEKRELDEQLADPAFYASPEVDQMKGLVLRQQEVTRLIDEAEQRWLELHAELEEIGGS
jgi:ATP-binding cassette, subfamily F, member 3